MTGPDAQGRAESTPSPIDELTSARVYDLAQPLEATTPVLPHHAPFRMAMMRRHGDLRRRDGSSGANELISLGGHAGTHIDALCHFSLDGAIHGDLDAAEACVGGRFSALGVETIEPIVSRGVLLDIPAALGMAALEPAHPITADDMEAACRAQGIDVRPGDAVLVRTGWPVGRFPDADAFLGWETGVPGPDVSAAEWLVERRVRVTGSDTAVYEQLVAGIGLTHLPVHVILLFRHGVPIIEVMNLEEIAADRVWTFTFIAAPLRIVGATGSPMRPLALVSDDRA
jgi:kynurenine formamidase